MKKQTKEEFKIEIILDKMVEKGYLDKIGNGYIDSKLTKQMLRDGLKREEIAYVLENEWILK
jgi:hypothetical protein